MEPHLGVRHLSRVSAWNPGFVRIGCPSPFGTRSADDVQCDECDSARAIPFSKAEPSRS